MTKTPVGFLVVCLLILASCNNQISEAMEGEKTSLSPINTQYDAIVEYKNNGVLSSRLSAKQIDRYQTEDTAYLILSKGFKAEFFDSLGQYNSELQAKYGEWIENQHIMKGSKNVRFKNIKNEFLYTESLIWYQDSALIITDKPVKIVRPDGVIYGIGLRAAEDFSAYTINQISGELYVEDNDSLFTEKDSLP